MKKISIIYGGRSTEHDASIKSYENIVEQLDKNRFSIENCVYIERDGTVLLNKRKISFGTLIDTMEKSDTFLINLLHGTEGEDGAWSGVADIRDIKGSFESVNTSSILMNKKQQEDIIKSTYKNVLKTPLTITCKYGDDMKKAINEIKTIKSEYVVVKPNNMGASHLTEKIKTTNIEAIEKLIANIHKYDEMALIQEYIQGDEYTCGVIRKNNDLLALEVIKVNTHEQFLGHKEKHNKGYTEVLFINNELTNTIKDMSKKLFNLFGVIGMCRFDFLVKNNTIYYLEGNLIPGFSKGSAFPRMLKESNIDMNDFIEVLINSFSNKKKRIKYLKYDIED